MNINRLLSVFLFSSIVASTTCYAQPNIDLSNLFSPSNQLDVADWSVSPSDETTNTNDLTVTQLLVDSAPLRFQPALYEWKRQDELAALEYVVFSHLQNTNFTEATYEPELQIGYSQPLQGMDNTLFNISVASIKQCANGFAANSLSVLGNDNISDRSAFLSVSIHSKF